MNELINQRVNNTTDKSPFFSIIIPVYNASAYIEECIADILKQDFDNWEMVIVDDCSGDDSIAKAKTFSRVDSRIKVFTSDKNSGGAHTPRMRAAKLAKGQYIVTIDADDRVSSDLLTTLYECIKAMNADLVIPEMWRFNESQNSRILPLGHIDVKTVWSGKDLVEHTLCKWAIPMAGFAIRREIYLEADKRLTDEDKRWIFVDELLSRWILYMCSSVCLCQAKYYYRQNSESVTNVNVPRFIDSKLKLCDSLISMTAQTFGEYSHTHMRALENKFYAAVDLLRLINKSALDNQEKAKYTERISSAMKEFDLSKLEGRVSPRYLAIMRLPIPLARIAFKIIDPFIKLKNGI